MMSKRHCVRCGWHENRHQVSENTGRCPRFERPAPVWLRFLNRLLGG